MPTAYIKKTGMSIDTLEDKWSAAKAAAKKQGHTDDYAYIMGIFNSMIHVAKEDLDDLPDEFQRWLHLQPDHVLRQTTVISGPGSMLHLDLKTPPHFIPQMPRSAARSEDNTVARITVAPTIRGCIQAYARFTDSLGYDGRNGMYINRMSYDHCLKPTAQLCFDAEITDEHWLVTYSADTRVYTPTQIGRIWVHRMITSPVSQSSVPKRTVELYIEIDTDDAVALNDDIDLTRGWYLCVADFTYIAAKGVIPVCPIIVSCVQVPKDQYEQQKSISASMLDHTSTNIPLFTKW